MLSPLAVVAIADDPDPGLSMAPVEGGVAANALARCPASVIVNCSICPAVSSWRVSGVLDLEN